MFLLDVFSSVLLHWLFKLITFNYFFSYFEIFELFNGF